MRVRGIAAFFAVACAVPFIAFAAIDSKGNFCTAEAGTGRRAQKFGRLQ